MTSRTIAHVLASVAVALTCISTTGATPCMWSCPTGDREGTGSLSQVGCIYGTGANLHECDYISGSLLMNSVPSIPCPTYNITAGCPLVDGANNAFRQIDCYYVDSGEVSCVYDCGGTFMGGLGASHCAASIIQYPSTCTVDPCQCSSDGASCGSSDVCLSGVCTDPCASNPCTSPGTCQASMGTCTFSATLVSGNYYTCSYTTESDGTACGGANSVCVSGSCTPQCSPNPCTSPDACHTGTGTCSATSTAVGGHFYNCSYTAQTDGTSCGSDSVCLSGGCAMPCSGNPCSVAPDVCHTGGTCSFSATAQTGGEYYTCSYPFGTDGATCTGTSGNVGFCSEAVGRCIDCFNYTSGSPVFDITAINTTFLRETVTVPLGWFVMNASADIDVIGTDPSCAGLRVLGGEACVTVREVQCLTYTGGFERAADVTTDYIAGRIAYSYDINPSDPATKNIFGITIAGSTMYTRVKVCRLIPEQSIGVDLPLDLSNFTTRLPANMECYIDVQQTDIEIDSSGALTLVNAMYLVEVGTDGRLSWSINETVYTNCTFSTVPTLASMSCGARSCVVGTVMPSYSVNISALCLLSDGVTERQLPVMIVNNLANQYFTSAISGGTLNGATFVYLSTDVYSIIVPYPVKTAVVTATDGSGSWVIVNNGAGIGLSASVSQTSDQYTNVTFTPGSLYPGTYNLSLSMVFALGRKFGVEEFEMGSDTATEGRTFTVITTSNPASSSGSPSVSASRRRTAVVVGVFVGVTAVVVIVAAVHTYLKKRRNRSRTNAVRMDVKIVSPFPIAAC